MDDLPLSTSSGPVLPSPDVPPFPFSFEQPAPRHGVDSAAHLEALRHDLAGGTRSTDSILRAATDAARVLSGADGTALALRTRGAIVCRARSGDIAPELGAPLNVGSGISGECLRSASILLCNDTLTDMRVDPEVCLVLGVRSVVAVPLRGPIGIAGILEAFSTRAHAFGTEQIDFLRALAEIAEAAYDRESRSQGPVRPSVTSDADRPTLFPAPAVTNQIREGKASEERFLKSYWIFGAVAFALLLISAVLWLGWHEPAAEIAARETPARSLSAPDSTSSDPALRVAALKPNPGIAGRQSERSRKKEMLQNAAEIQPATDGPHSLGTVPNRSLPQGSEKATGSSAPPNSAVEPPPSIEVAISTPPQELATSSSAPAILPTFGGTISHGISDANLVHRVDPIYPPQARIRRLTGSVTLEATIAKDGSVHEVKVVSGPSLLAAAATAAVRQWRYSPSTLDGKAIEVQTKITIVFKLP